MIDTYIYIVSQTTGFSKTKLLSRGRTSQLCDARFCLYLALYDTTSLSYYEIGKQLRKDHTTIIHGVNKAKCKLSSDARFAHLYHTIETILSEEIQNGWHDKHRMYVEFPSGVSGTELLQRH